MRLIFGYALNGHGPNYIRRRLEEEKIPCPTWWNRERGLRNTRTKWEKKDPENGRYMWDFSVIKDLLMNPVYTGAIASQKKDYRFKIGTIGEKKPEDWIVVEGQHEPLIDRMSFDIVQNKLKSVSYTHLDVYKRQVLHNIKAHAVNQRFVLSLNHNPVLRFLFPNRADFEAVVFFLGSNRPGVDGIHQKVFDNGEVPHIPVSYTHLRGKPCTMA